MQLSQGSNPISRVLEVGTHFGSLAQTPKQVHTTSRAERISVVQEHKTEEEGKRFELTCLIRYFCAWTVGNRATPWLNSKFLLWESLVQVPTEFVSNYLSVKHQGQDCEGK